MVKSALAQYICYDSARQRYMFDLATVIRRDHKKLAAIMTEEHGKTTPDSMGDVQRGLEVVEHSCAISHIYQG